MPNSDDEWRTELSNDQIQMHQEVAMMVQQLSEGGFNIEYSLRGYDMKHMVVLEGDKCYGQAPKVHAYLSGALTIARSKIDD